MDGKTLYKYGAAALGGIDDNDKRFFYDCLDAAALDFVRQTRILTSEAVITTVEGHQTYDLPADYIEPYLKDRRQRFVAKYHAGAYDFWPCLTSFEKIYRANTIERKNIPERFAVRDRPARDNAITGMAADAGAALAGSCVLYDPSAVFTCTVEPRDLVHNVNDGSDGVVLSVTDDAHVVCALFDGERNAWAENDSYVITPAANYQVYLDAPSDTSGHTLYMPYLCMPSPVYSDYNTWRFSPMSCRAICYEAAFLFNVDYETDLKNFERLHDLFSGEIIRTNRETALKRLQGGRYPGRR